MKFHTHWRTSSFQEDSNGVIEEQVMVQMGLFLISSIISSLKNRSRLRCSEIFKKSFELNGVSFSGPIYRPDVLLLACNKFATVSISEILTSGSSTVDNPIAIRVRNCSLLIPYKKSFRTCLSSGFSLASVTDSKVR
ncbi:hypothetical protein ADUPG1_012587 [Aduncisulcus paluster]|uniref:Uncharacterized protein n=1 Tax=Aduncisulcus paluster TaxID=2918883 RepID=A0ABQ5K367_9EUKA|nr:hypothetical protein ADUPG1_012587 [Aduncisulcus paluster]